MIWSRWIRLLLQKAILRYQLGPCHLKEIKMGSAKHLVESAIKVVDYLW